MPVQRLVSMMLMMTVFALLPTMAAAADVVTLLSGDDVKLDVARIEADGRVLDAAGKPIGDGLQSLRRIAREGVKVKQPPKAHLVLMSGGGHLLADSVTTSTEHATITWAFGKEVKGQEVRLPLGLLLGIVEKAPADTTAARLDLEPKYLEALAQADAGQDRLFIQRSDRLLMFTGALKGLDDKNYAFHFEGEQRNLGRDRAFGVVLAQPTGSPDRIGQVLVRLRDGSAIWGAVRSLADGKLTLDIGQDTTMTLPWKDVVSMDVRSDRVAFLSDLDPVSAIEKPLVYIPTTWKRDTNVSGEPMRLGDRTYARGIGVHARSELTFDIAGRFDTFATTIGIDASTDGRGDCVFIVMGDDKKLFEQRVRGADAPRPIRLDVAGVRKLTLLVEPGENLDLGDHANWAEARLLRNAE